MNTKDKIEIMQAFLDGKEIEQASRLNLWYPVSVTPDWDWRTYTYRIKPQKQLVIPWEHIKPEYKWAAMDSDRKVFVFTGQPIPPNNPDGACWWARLADTYASINILNIDTDGVDWKQSLIERPEGV